VVNGFSRSVAARRHLAGAAAETFEHRGIALSPAPVWYARAGVTDRDAEKRRSPVFARGATVRSAEKRPLRSSSSAAALARGAAVCGAEVFMILFSASEMTYIVSSRALNSTHSLIILLVSRSNAKSAPRACGRHRPRRRETSVAGCLFNGVIKVSP